MTPPPAPQIDAAIRENIAAAWSAKTHRTYSQRLADVARWCDSIGIDSGIDFDDAGRVERLRFPLTPDLLLRYITTRDIDGYAPGTIKLALAALSAAHRESRLPDPTKEEDVKRCARGITKRHAATPKRQAKPITREIVEAMEAVCDPRDVAMAYALFDGGLRIGEAAALRWADVTRERDGTGRLRIRRSKADQTGRGAVVAVTPRGMDAIDYLRRLDMPPGSFEPDALVFAGLKADAIRQRVKRAGRQVGVEGLSGHSGRVGLAREMAEQGAPLHVVMQAGRWKSADVAASYIRNIEAAEALRYRSA